MTAAYDNATKIDSASNTTLTGASGTHTPVGTPALITMAVEVGVQGGNVLSTFLSTITYGGNAMTLAGTSVQASSTSARLFLYKLVGPPSGAQTAAVTFPSTGLCTVMLHVVSWTAGAGGTVDTANYNSTTSNAAGPSPSLNIAVGTIGNPVQSSAAHGDTISGVTSTYTQRLLSNINGVSAGGNTITGTAVSAANPTAGVFSSSFSDTWLVCGCEITESGGAAVAYDPAAQIIGQKQGIQRACQW